ncbi:DEAD/DEAH box helicase family protein [Thiothrix subterranea]|uniref:primosomal protein N' family DNA-binding protein n=1 Tax=Thiothrix subterranea TaxID=2735563 RepID=UPI00280B69F0|nr:DEAD/DEAH box helicase family protein [Thiothrix subterranea]
MSQTAYTLQIAVPRPLRTLLSYSHYADAALPVGTRVLVPFGKQQSVGLVISAERAPETDNPDAPFTIKPVDAVLDAMPLPDAHLLELLQWAARYYHHPVGEVIFSALPVALRKPKPLSTRLQKLLVSSTPTAATSPNPARLQLTDEQQQCLHYIQQWNAQIPRRPILLHGITGSGKTEIYLRLIAPLFAAGKQVLVIVPEIGLTPQLLLRFAHFLAIPRWHVCTPA